MNPRMSSPLRMLAGSSLALALLAGVSACSGPAPEAAGTPVPQAGGLQVSDAWIRQPPPGAAVAGAYLAIDNPGRGDDRLLGVDTAAAERIELHDMRMENGMMQMRELGDGLPLKAGTRTTLAPGGLHMMLINPRASLAVGSSVEATLRFEHAPAQTVLLEVRPLSGAAGADAADAHQGHDSHGDVDAHAPDAPDAHDAHAGHGDPAAMPAPAPAQPDPAAPAAAERVHDKH